ncbi:MAG TPA: prolyl oligopeptidase family serine peptidase [Pyrinomonadaceae bacterium]|nr:prolyl oligopeptidase family serine peptidase [Pyrinomonadaceae bacterium]
MERRRRARVPFAAIALMFVACGLAAGQSPGGGSFTLEQVRGYPFPNELTAAAAVPRVAWAFNERGLRNVYAAEGPEWRARRLTNYEQDDGQELTSLSFSRDGRFVVYVRGGEHGSNWDESAPVNPSSSPVQHKVQIWSVAFEGGAPKLLAEGDEPAISPRGDAVAFVKDRAVWVVPVDGSAQPRRMFHARGELDSPAWSPDGSRLAFVSNRGTHAFVGVYANDSTPVVWMSPTVARDSSPRWSPDGRRLAFVRRPGAGGPPEPILEQRPQPWSIWTADAATGEGRMLWRSDDTLRGSYPTTHGQANLHWAAAGRIVFLSYADGWPHLYSVPEQGGPAVLLTPGPYMAEYISLSPDRRWLVFAANAGKDSSDVDRRHVVRVPVDRAEPEVLTPGDGLEWTPFVTGDGRSVVYISATAQRPPLPAVKSLEGGSAARLIAAERLPRDFPAAQLVTPKQVVFKAPDGLSVHAQLFERPGGAARKPAIVYVHGGPPRQMLLGWHYSDYYSNAYALNQYLASRGYVVLSVNYRLGIGYGYEFHRPPRAGSQGAAEYQDIRAAGEYLRQLPQVDPARVGLYGGSYGGYLTALALARDSQIFAAGVDIHGVHDFTADGGRRFGGTDWRYEKNDRERAADVAWQSSPVASVGTWKSPVLLVHGDDDRNVRFSQTADLVRRLERAGVPHEVVVVPDDTHHFLRHANWLLVDAATAAFFDKHLRAGR